MGHGRDWLVSDGGLALPQGRDVDGRVLMIRSDVHDPLDVRLLLDHLPVVLVGADAAGTILLLVVRLHDLAGDVPTAADAGVTLAPSRLFEKAPNPVAVAV